jgi:hypothetical protein
MKTFRSFWMIGALTLGANAVLAAAPADNWLERWFKAKYGTNTPSEEARLKAERERTAFRAEPVGPPARVNWVEEHLKAKLGRYTPAEEARLRTEREREAFRAEPAAPAHTFFEEWYRGKYGRYPGK